MSILDAVDQRVKDAGFNFVPFNRFLASPFQISANASTAVDDPATAGIPAIYRPQGGGGGYFENLRPEDQRGFIGNFQNINPNEMYPAPMTIDDIDPDNFEESYAQYEKDQLKGEPVPGMDIPAINFKDAPVDFMLSQNNPRVFDPLVNAKNLTMQGVDKTKDLGAKVFGGILSAATGVPFLGPALEGFAGQFENRPLGAAVIDEFGNVYSEDELNKQNALGGFYTNAARSARRRTRRIQNMLQRQAQGKKISLANLRRLQAQEKKQEEIRQAAADRMQAQNRAARTGGYQAGYGSDFMEGPGGGRDMGQEATSPGSSGPGGSDTMGSFMDGGIVDLVDIYD